MRYHRIWLFRSLGILLTVLIYECGLQADAQTADSPSPTPNTSPPLVRELPTPPPVGTMIPTESNIDFGLAAKIEPNTNGAIARPMPRVCDKTLGAPGDSGHNTEVCIFYRD